MTSSDVAAGLVPPPSRLRGQAIAVALAIMLLALAIRIPLALQPVCIDRNGVQFVEFARQLGDDPIRWMKSTTRQPGFAALLLLTHSLFNDFLGGDSPEAWQRCGEALALIGGVATCGLVFFLGRALFDVKIGAVSGLLAAVWPQGAEMSAEALSDMPHLALYLAALLCLLQAISSGRKGTLFVGGAILGLCYLMRQEAVGLLAAGTICWLIDSPQKGLGGRVLGAGILAFGFIVAASPHSMLTGRWIPNKNPLDLLRFLHRPASGPAAAGLLLGYDLVWWKAVGNVVSDWLRSGRVVIPALFLAGAVAPNAPRSERRGWRLVAFAAAAQVCLLQVRAAVYGELSTRYVAILVALSLPWAASGWLTIIRRVGGHRLGVAAAVVVPLAPLCVYLARPVYGKEHYRTAGRWIREHAQAGDRVLAHENLEQVMYYADRTYPSSTWIKSVRADGVEQVAARIAADSPAWFVDAEATHRGMLDEDAYFGAIRAGRIAALTPAAEFGPAGKRVLVYRIESAK